jgi:hypothetical protein
MDVIVPRQSALDVHKAQVTACVRVPGEAGERVQQVEQFATTVRGLLVLRDWLQAHGVTWHLLEDEFELMLVNARHVKQVPGRKTDVKDAGGSASWSSTGWCGPASSRRPRSASCAS